MMKNQCLIGLTIALLFFVAANVKADTIPVLEQLSSEEVYKILVSGNDWMFENVGTNNRGNPLEIKFDGGSLALSEFNGKGSGYKPVAQAIDDGRGLRFDHNSANTAVISFDEPYVNDLFYVNILSDHTAVVETFNITVKGVNGTYSIENLSPGWVGFILSDDFIESITIEAQAVHFGAPNDGFHVEFGAGKYVPLPSAIPTPSSAPEPGTLVLMGLGLAGIGLARRQMKK